MGVTRVQWPRRGVMLGERWELGQRDEQVNGGVENEGLTAYQTRFLSGRGEECGRCCRR